MFQSKNDKINKAYLKEGLIDSESPNAGDI